LKTVSLHQQIEDLERRNSELLKRLLELKANLDVIRDIDFFFFFKNEEQIADFEKAQPKLNLATVHVSNDKGYKQYVKFVGKMSLSDAVNNELTRSFAKSAVENGGKYDGWGAAV
jgi:hypothetical protein